MSLKFDPKPSEAPFSAVLFNFDKCRPKVASDVISGVTVEWIGVDVRLKFGDSRSNVLMENDERRRNSRNSSHSAFCSLHKKLLFAISKEDGNKVITTMVIRPLNDST